MDLSYFIFLFLTVVLFGLFFTRPLVLLIESLVAVLISFALNLFFFDSILRLAGLLGISENIYTPPLIFILGVIVIWAVIFSTLSSLIKFGAIVKNYRAGFWALIFALAFALIIFAIGCLTITPFIQSQETIDIINDCYICRLVNKEVGNLPQISNHLVKFSPDVYMPENENKVIVLPSDFEVLTFNQDKTNQVFNLINQTRQTVGVEELELDDGLFNLAKAYGQEISQTKYFSHRRENGEAVDKRSQQAGLKFNYIGENLAIAKTAELAHQALLKSQSHYKNIISPVFKKVGIAVFDLKNDYVMIIEEFAS